MAEKMPDPRTADASSDRHRQVCTDCGRRRTCRDFVWFGVPGIGISLCGPCESLACRSAGPRGEVTDGSD